MKLHHFCSCQQQQKRSRFSHNPPRVGKVEQALEHVVHWNLFRHHLRLWNATSSHLSIINSLHHAIHFNLRLLNGNLLHDRAVFCLGYIHIVRNRHLSLPRLHHRSLVMLCDRDLILLSLHPDSPLRSVHSVWNLLRTTFVISVCNGPGYLLCYLPRDFDGILLICIPCAWNLNCLGVTNYLHTEPQAAMMSIQGDS